MSRSSSNLEIKFAVVKDLKIEFAVVRNIADDLDLRCSTGPAIIKVAQLVIALVRGALEVRETIVSWRVDTCIHFSFLNRASPMAIVCLL